MSEKVAGSTLSLASSSRFLREVRLLCIAWWCHASARKEGVAPLGEDSSVEKIRKDACTFFVSKAHVSLCEPRALRLAARAERYIPPSKARSTFAATPPEAQQGDARRKNAFASRKKPSTEEHMMRRKSTTYL